jgi:riboflavin synthase
MFTGIIETTGIITNIKKTGSNTSFWIKSSISHTLKADQSVSHNGVCLTVEEIIDDIHKVTAIEETLLKTNLSSLSIGSMLNLERCLSFNGRIDGHLVQGHIDTTAICLNNIDKNGSWEYQFIF